MKPVFTWKEHSPSLGPTSYRLYAGRAQIGIVSLDSWGGRGYVGSLFTCVFPPQKTQEECKAHLIKQAEVWFAKALAGAS